MGITARLLTLAGAALLMAAVAAGCSSDSPRPSEASASSPSTTSSVASPLTNDCGVTLRDAQAAVPAGIVVHESPTVGLSVCNFAWNSSDGGSWTINVTLGRGGRAEIEASDQAPRDGGSLRNGIAYEVVTGLGDRA